MSLLFVGKVNPNLFFTYLLHLFHHLMALFNSCLGLQEEGSCSGGTAIRYIFSAL